jgi:rRNA-processing protein FCF1
MTDALNTLLLRFHGRDVLIDTNILLMYFVGSLDPKRIATFKRTAAFTVEDYMILVRFLQFFRAIVTTPNILTEVSNLAGQIAEPLRTPVFQIFAQAVQVISEQYVQSRMATENTTFVRFGLTDAVIASMTAGEVLVLTDDFRLSQYLEHSGLPVVNFNHLRVLI